VGGTALCELSRAVALSKWRRISSKTRYISHERQNRGQKEPSRRRSGRRNRGVSAACSLLNRAVDVMVFEQATTPWEIGAGGSFFRTVFGNWNEWGSAKP
jgi:hypothetical protein